MDLLSTHCPTQAPPRGPSPESEITYICSRQALGQECSLQLVAPVLDLETDRIASERVYRSVSILVLSAHGASSIDLLEELRP